MDDNETEKEPTTESTPPAPTPPAPTPPAQSDSGAGERLDAIEAKLAAVAEAIAGLVPGAVDSSPAKRPWTHWGSRR